MSYRLVLVIVLLLSGPVSAASPSPAEVIYVGRIITMAGQADGPRARAEAVAVIGDRIIAVGTRKDVMRLRNRDTRVVELGRSAMLPGLIDAHGHLTATATSLAIANLSSPPVGEVSDIATLKRTLRRFIDDRKLSPGTVVIGFGYDDAQLAEKRHPTRDDLDDVSTDHPIFLSHVSGHLGAANSSMLKKAGIDATTADPEGGVFRRRDGSQEPNGVLEEAAMTLVRAKVPLPALEDSLKGLSAALTYYASMGVTTVQDGALMASNRALLDEAARRELLTLDVVTYQLWMPIGMNLKDFVSAKSYDHRVKNHGIKLILDGSPQGKTAFLSQPYRSPPAGKPASYLGYPNLPAPVIDRVVEDAVQYDIPLLAHANGDAAAELLIDAVAGARKKHPEKSPKVVMIHAQTVRDDQLDRMKALGITPSFFVGHTYYWGDWHRDETLGPERAARISPTRSALERGLNFTLHTDTPVVPPNMLRTLWSATTRRTRTQDILGPSQRISTWDALKGLTINAALQEGDGELKGSIEIGKQADFVVLSDDPLAVDPENLQQITVLETISRGKSVWRADGNASAR